LPNSQKPVARADPRIHEGKMARKGGFRERLTKVRFRGGRLLPRSNVPRGMNRTGTRSKWKKRLTQIHETAARVNPFAAALT